MNLLLMLSMLFFSSLIQAQEYQLGTHILDISIGRPVYNVAVELFKQNDTGEWISIQQTTTSQDGRGHLLPKSTENTGIYKLRYFVEPYLQTKNQKYFFPYIEVNIEIDGDQNYHIPIALSGNGYSPFMLKGN